MRKMNLEDLDLIVNRINSTHLLGKKYKIKISLYKTKAEIRTVRIKVILTHKGEDYITLMKNLNDEEAYLYLSGFEKGLPVLQW